MKPPLTEELLASDSCLERVSFPQGVAHGMSTATQARPHSQEYLNSIKLGGFKKVGRT